MRWKISFFFFKQALRVSLCVTAKDFKKKKKKNLCVVRGLFKGYIILFITCISRAYHVTNLDLCVNVKRFLFYSLMSSAAWPVKRAVRRRHNVLVTNHPSPIK